MIWVFEVTFLSCLKQCVCQNCGVAFQFSALSVIQSITYSLSFDVSLLFWQRIDAAILWYQELLFCGISPSQLMSLSFMVFFLRQNSQIPKGIYYIFSYKKSLWLLQIIPYVKYRREFVDSRNRSSVSLCVVDSRIIFFKLSPVHTDN